MSYCLYIDGTFCTHTNGDYERAKPFHDLIPAVNTFCASGHVIKLFTSLGSITGIDWRALAERQMHDWEVRYHELIMVKPEADVFIDD